MIMIYWPFASYETSQKSSLFLCYKQETLGSIFCLHLIVCRTGVSSLWPLGQLLPVKHCFVVHTLIEIIILA